MPCEFFCASPDEADYMETLRRFQAEHGDRNVTWTAEPGTAEGPGKLIGLVFREAEHTESERQ